MNLMVIVLMNPALLDVVLRLTLGIKRTGSDWYWVLHYSPGRIIELR